jgi:hypothetical protein
VALNWFLIARSPRKPKLLLWGRDGLYSSSNQRINNKKCDTVAWKGHHILWSIHSYRPADSRITAFALRLGTETIKHETVGLQDPTSLRLNHFISSLLSYAINISLVWFSMRSRKTSNTELSARTGLICFLYDIGRSRRQAHKIIIKTLFKHGFKFNLQPWLLGVKALWNFEPYGLCSSSFWWTTT